MCPGAEFGPLKGGLQSTMLVQNFMNEGWNVLCIGSKNDEDIGMGIGSLNNLRSNKSFINLIENIFTRCY